MSNEQKCVNCKQLAVDHHDGFCVHDMGIGPTKYAAQAPASTVLPEGCDNSTPETDAKQFLLEEREQGFAVDAEFARSLEIRLRAAEAQLAALRSAPPLEAPGEVEEAFRRVVQRMRNNTNWLAALEDMSTIEQALARAYQASRQGAVQQPVAWQGRKYFSPGATYEAAYGGRDPGAWCEWEDLADDEVEEWKRLAVKFDIYEVRPLYTHPSPASHGVREALEWAEHHAGVVYEFAKERDKGDLKSGWNHTHAHAAMTVKHIAKALASLDPGSSKGERR